MKESAIQAIAATVAKRKKQVNRSKIFIHPVEGLDFGALGGGVFPVSKSAVRNEMAGDSSPPEAVSLTLDPTIRFAPGSPSYDGGH